MTDGFNPAELSDDDLRAAAIGDEDDEETVDTEGEQGAEAPGGSDDQAESDQGQQADDNRNWNPEGPGDVREALRQERETRRQYEAQVAEYQQQLAAYQQYMQQAQAQQYQQEQEEPPNPWEDPAGYTRWEIQQALGPVQQQLQHATGYIQQLEYQRDLMAFEAQYPGAAGVIQQIDSQIPEMRGMGLEAKYYMWLGAQKSDPQNMERLVEEKAKQMAAQMTSKQLTGKTAPPSLAHIGSSTTGAPAPLPLHKLTDEQLRKRARGEE